MNHMPLPTGTLAFIGGGNMGRSLIGGLIARGIPPERIAVTDPSADVRDGLVADFGIRANADAANTVRDAALVLLAVKPQVMRDVCQSLAPCLPAHAVAVSIAAGITSAQLDTWLGGGRAVVRAMPNTPALLGVGATGLYANSATHSDQRVLADAVMSAVGIGVWLDDETQMDTVTALSGSGPAYFFLLAEAMQAAAVAMGLPESAARALAAQTCLGAGRMLMESGEDAATLRRRVTSPGGTTQAALESFQRDEFAAIVERAIHAAKLRGAALSTQAGN
ncbi:pyrroline-5-carboxylate reductase [Xanthomonadaceae bacterium JHOS43]|nr:pyrroline-5-carboxylate reductase [Xanthomonadaceae bacterium JHOS43]MCX7563649.1 pyrroline-5-carboxylate reductase [Xanthomonadaceae bacterium XH05]